MFPDIEACRVLCPDLPANAAAAAVTGDPRVRARMQAALTRLAALSTGASTLIRRAIVTAEPPSLDTGEATDKGSINQRVVLRHRAALVEDLYAEPAPGHVIALEENQ
jgi:feruloyl-CoA synthase